jgi:hypothetical protein
MVMLQVLREALAGELGKAKGPSPDDFPDCRADS